MNPNEPGGADPTQALDASIKNAEEALKPWANGNGLDRGGSIFDQSGVQERKLKDGTTVRVRPLANGQWEEVQ